MFWCRTAHNLSQSPRILASASGLVLNRTFSLVVYFSQNASRLFHLIPFLVGRVERIASVVILAVMLLSLP